MAALPERYVTPEEYLEFERKSETRHEYIDGVILPLYRDAFGKAMAGASATHGRIMHNLNGILWSQLRGRPCGVWSGDMRVQISETGMYAYPDVVIVCGEPRFIDKREDTLTNPLVIIEVLSPSTEAYDRGEKFAHYRRLPSLQEYLLVSQDKARLEHFIRQDEDWRMLSTTSVTDLVSLPSAGCQLLVADVYLNVTFPERPNLFLD